MLQKMSIGTYGVILAHSRRALIKYPFILAILGFMMLSSLFSGPSKDTPRSKIHTEAVVIDVAEARSSRTGKPRLWVTFEYDTPDGNRLTRRQRMRTNKDVSIGQRITVSYRKRRPKRARVASLRAPPPKVSPDRSPTWNTDKLLPWLIGLVTLPLFAFGIYLMFGACNSKRRDAGNQQRQSEQNPRTRTASRYGGKRSASTVSITPKRKSKVVQRVSWF